MVRSEVSGPGDALVPEPKIDAFLEAKLHRPRDRSDWLRRQRLLSRVEAVLHHPVTLVAAPAGYGKTTLLTQLVTEVQPRTAWVSLDAGDNDPHRLWTHVAAALERAGCAVNARAPDSLLHAIIEALSASDEDILLVLDDFHFVRDPQCHHQVERLVEYLPAQAHLVVMTRSDPALRLGRLRASGGLLEIRADELGFTTAEAEALFEREELALSAVSVSMLVECTEGWPAGLYLASLALSGRIDPDSFVHDFSGENRYIVDYLTEEVLSGQSAEIREFIVRVSILGRFTARLCDSVLESTCSASILRGIERANLFLVPLDDEGRWFRFHHLFAAVARSELEITHPEMVAVLHSRAASWFSAEGNVDEAVRHSIAGGDLQTASVLVQENWLEYVDAGRIATVVGWAKSIRPPRDNTNPAASVMAAWMAALAGDEMTLAELLSAMETFGDHGPLPDGSRSVNSAIAMIQGLFGYGGPIEMMRGAERAVSLEVDPSSPFYAVARVSLGHAAYVAGDLDRAVHAISSAQHNGRSPVIVHAFGLATESLAEDERGNLQRSQDCAELAVDLLSAHKLRATPQASLAYTALGRTYAAAGRHEQALETLEQARVLRRMTTSRNPWATMHHLVVHARVAAEAGRIDLAREMLTELDVRVARFTDGMAAMHARVGNIRRLVWPSAAPPVPGDPLTGRELDILRLLRGTMSLHEIADELYLSFNTVKTHARAVYRKLGVHTRAEAVDIGRQQGLL